jgi:hypothetical protein
MRPLLDSIAALDRRLSERRIPSVLPFAALCVGCIWIAALGWHSGIRGAGDTRDYLTRIQGLSGAGSYFAFLYEERYLNAHMTTVWMWVLGPTLFVLVTAALTALLPFLVDLVLRQCAVGPLFRLIALLFTGTHPELYSWSWFVLTDGFFLIQIVGILVLITRRSYPALWWCLIPALTYNVVYTRPTGLLLLPGLAAYGFAQLDRRKRRFLVACSVIMSVWVVGWVLVSGGRRSQHTQIARDNFIGGHMLQNPYMGYPMPVPFSASTAGNRTIADLCASYPAYCAEYYTRKWFTYFLPVFPKYSIRHQAMNALFFGGLLVFGAVGMLALLGQARRVGWRACAARPQFAAALFCGVTMLTAGVFHTATHIDSDARYIIVWTPVWIAGVCLLLSLGTQPAATHSQDWVRTA